MSKLNSTPPGSNELNKINSSPVNWEIRQSTPVLTDGVKSDVSELLNPLPAENPGLTIAEKSQIDDFVKSGKKMTDKCLREFPARLRGEYLASKLMEVWKWSAVAIHLEKFHWVDHKVLASQFKKTMGCRIIIENIHNFTWLDHSLLANELINTGRWDMLSRNLHNFTWLDHIILYKLIEMWKWNTVIRFLNRFLRKDEQTTASKLIEKLLWHEWIGYIKLAKELKEQWLLWVIVENLEKFPWIESLYYLDTDPIFISSIDELRLNTRTYNCLRSYGIQTLWDLVLYTENELLKCPNLWRKSLNEIKEVLASRNLSLGVLIKNLSPKS